MIRPRHFLERLLRDVFTFQIRQCVQVEHVVREGAEPALQKVDAALRAGRVERGEQLIADVQRVRGFPSMTV